MKAASIFQRKFQKNFFAILLGGENMIVKIVCLYIEGDENTQKECVQPNIFAIKNILTYDWINCRSGNWVGQFHIWRHCLG